MNEIEELLDDVIRAFSRTIVAQLLPDNSEIMRDYTIKRAAITARVEAQAARIQELEVALSDLEAQSARVAALELVAKELLWHFVYTVDSADNAGVGVSYREIVDKLFREANQLLGGPNKTGVRLKNSRDERAEE
jgi:hypothetical protein